MAKSLKSESRKPMSIRQRRVSIARQVGTRPFFWYCFSGFGLSSPCSCMAASVPPEMTVIEIIVANATIAPRMALHHRILRGK